MSSREPMWYCHECHAEMRPLMVPEPTCASCHGTFVEKMENPSDDPREFNQHGLDDLTPGIDGFLSTLHALSSQRRDRDTHRRISPGGLTFEVRSSSGGPRTFTFGGSRSLSPQRGAPSLDADGDVPTMSDFLRRGQANAPRNNQAQIPGPILAQYLLALLGNRDPALQAIFANNLGGGDSMTQGRMGDYVFSQEALDQIITQLMENSNSHRPVPASEEKIQELSRDVLETGSPLLEKDCAVCKDQFKLETEDPDEQIVVTLPCKHPFHEPCIIPWLKSSGTCPVCRYALVPQPDQHGAGPAPGSSSGGGSPHSRSPPRSPDSNSNNDGGLFHSLFNIMGSNSSGGGSGASRQRGNSSDSTTDNSRPSHIPGEWYEDLD